MNVYCLECDTDRFHFVYANPAGDAQTLLFHAQGEPYGSTWKPARHSYCAVGSEDYNPKATFGDFVGVGGNANIGLTAHAAERAARLLLPYGELLPLNIDGDLNKIFWFHCTNVLDALDEGKSKVKCFPNGRIMVVDEYAFLADRVGVNELFHLKDERGRVFCTESLKQKIEAQNLTGLDFTLLWSDEPAGIKLLNERRLRSMNGPSAAVN
jgi:hypothetical protein